ncbi:LytR family transcriptional regulator, partial [Nocardia cyriacigeorgica]|nr:LytR family transcriptional regulator [Nocardia cyriacigeorgica]
MSYPKPTSGGIPLRALAMVLIALAIVFAGLGAMSL